MKTKIIADSTCDLSQELLDEYNICLTRLYIEIDGAHKRDGSEVTPFDIFEYVDRTGKLCHTAAVNVADYEEAYAEALKEYDGVIQLTISSDMSSCCQNARIAAEKFENVYVIDSRTLSSGIGQLAIECAERAERGMDTKQIYEEVSAMAEKLNVSFIIEKLDYLAKGGRCSTVAAISAGLLGIKPSIEVVDGKMGVGKKYRGKMSAAVKAYVEDRLKGRDDIETRRIFITYAPLTDDETICNAENTVRECASFTDIYRTTAGSTISTHCGPYCIGILYFNK